MLADTESDVSRQTFLSGDSLTGRKTLISKIIGDEKELFRGHGLSYEYINITGKDDEDVGVLSFVTIDPSAGF